MDLQPEGVSPQFVRAKKINDLLACAFFCCRYGNYQNLGDRIDDLLAIGISVPEIENIHSINKQNLLFAITEEKHLENVVSVYSTYDDGKYQEVFVLNLPIFYDQNARCTEVGSIIHRLYYKNIFKHIDTNCRQGQVECLGILDQKGFDIMKCNDYGQLTFHSTARIEIMQYYLNQGVNIDHPLVPLEDHIYQRTTLSNALFWNTPESLKYARFLIENGADLNLNNQFKPSDIEFDRRIIGEFFSFRFCFDDLHVDFFRYLIEQGIDLKDLTIKFVINEGCRNFENDFENEHNASKLVELISIMEKQGFQLTIDDFKNIHSLNNFTHLWKYFTRQASQSKYRKIVESTILMISSNNIYLSEAKIDIITGCYFQKFSSDIHHKYLTICLTIRSKSFPKQIEKTIIDLAYCPDFNSPLLISLEKDVWSSELKSFKIKFKSLAKLIVVQREIDGVADYLLKLIVDCLEDEQFDKSKLVKMASIIYTYCSPQNDVRRFIPLALECDDLKSFSTFIDTINTFEKKHLKPEGALIPRKDSDQIKKELRFLVHQYYPQLPSYVNKRKINKKERREQTKKIDSFFRIIKKINFDY